MSHDTPFMRVNRLVVTGGYTLDIPFTAGLNIILGDNGSGKSTLANLIVYALGGHVRNFPDEIGHCHSVFLELTVNGTILTLERYLNDSRASIRLYRTAYPTSERPDEVRISHLSDKLLEYLGFPRVQIPVGTSDGKVSYVSITFMKLFEWLYFDQHTEARFITRANTDQTTKQAVTDLFLGVLDLGTYSLQSELAHKKSRRNHLSSRVRSIEEFLGPNVKASADQRRELVDSLSSHKESRARLLKNSRANSDVLEQMRVRLRDLDAESRTVGNSTLSMADKISDVDLLINQLHDETVAAEQARGARQALVALRPVRCPSCGQSLGVPAGGHCPTCYRPEPQPTEVGYDSHILALRGRIADARAVRSRFEVRLGEGEAKQAEISTARGKLLEQIEDYTAAYVTPFAAELNMLSEQIGALNRQIEELDSASSQMRRLALWRSELGALTKQVADLEFNLAVAQSTVNRRLESFDEALNDFLQPEIYPGVSHAELDRQGLEPKVDQRYVEEITAASDTVVARLAYYVAWLTTSIRGMSLYPRFLMIDTPANKGLDEPRIEAIVQYVADLTANGPLESQVILTTGVAPKGVDRLIRKRLNKKQGIFLLQPREAASP